MDLKIFDEMTEKAGDNKDLASLISKAKGEAETVVSLKDKAVQKEQKLREHKHNVNKLFGVESEASLDDSLSAITTKKGEMDTSIESYKKSASGGQNTIAELQTQISQLSGTVTELTDGLSKKDAEVARSAKETEYRKALAEQGVTDPANQDLAIAASMNQVMGQEDVSGFAKTFVEGHKALTETGHIGGGGRRNANDNEQNAGNLSAIDQNDKDARTNAIAEKLAQKSK